MNLRSTTTLPRDAFLKPVMDNLLDFNLPPGLEASKPPEARGLRRDEVRLMVSRYLDDQVTHTQFYEIAQFLNAGDVLVINTSGTMNAALPATRADGTPFELHLSTHLPEDLWIVEVRQHKGTSTQPFFMAQSDEIFQLPAEATAALIAPYNVNERGGRSSHTRLWIATLNLPCPVLDYLAEYGFPIRYRYVKEGWPNSYYQTVYVTETGSAEMPSAGRAFTAELITRLVAKGVHVAPLILHTGVASLEDHEPPYEEYYRVPLGTAQVVNAARAAQRRVVAVGTTVVRALETVTDPKGDTHPGEGWTRLIITPERGIWAVDGMLTGLHEPRATHLAMLEALAGRYHLRMSYEQALNQRYLWHEFGDLHLILP